MQNRKPARFYAMSTCSDKKVKIPPTSFEKSLLFQWILYNKVKLEKGEL